MNKIKREEREDLHTFSDTTNLILQKKDIPLHSFSKKLGLIR